MARLGHLLVVDAGLSVADTILHALEIHDISAIHELFGTTQHGDQNT